MAFRALAALAVLGALSAMALGAAPASRPSRPELAPAVALSHRAQHLKAAFQTGDPRAIQGAIQEVELLRRTYGTLDVAPLVEAMAIFARDLGDQRRPEAGLEVVRTMEHWAPRSGLLLGTRVILMRRQGFRGALGSLADLIDLTRLRLAQPQHRWLWLLQHLAWLPFMATLLLWGWALAMALRYRRVFRDLWEGPLARRGVNPPVRALAGAFLITLPVLLGLDPSPAAMLWLILLAPFLLPSEIRGTILVIALQLIHPALGLLAPLAAQQPAPSLVALQMRPQPLVEDGARFAALPADDRAFLKGWRLLQLQDWTGAQAVFSALAKAHAGASEIVNNLGVARYERGDLAGAQACFDQAEALQPRRAEVLLNQSMVAFKQMDSTLGSDRQDQARQADPEGFTRLLAANQAGNDQRTFALPLPDTPQRSQALGASLEPGPGPAAHLGHRALLFVLLLPMAALGLFLLRVRQSRDESHPTQCSRCGDPFHTTDSPDPLVCTHCHHLTAQRSGLQGESRKQRRKAVGAFQRSQRWLTRILLCLLPGLGGCFRGDTRQGLVEFGFFSFALGLVLATAPAVRYGGEILADPPTLLLPLGFALLAVAFARSWFKLLPWRF
jgi:tetratricopeptide (TPR) repeat protein